MTIKWIACPPAPLAWIEFRELPLQLIDTTAFLMPLLALVAALLVWCHRLSRLHMLEFVLLLPPALRKIYCPASTALPAVSLQQQFTASGAAPLCCSGGGVLRTWPRYRRFYQGHCNECSSSSVYAHVYISGDELTTTEQLFSLGF
ncbi:hypothetical protein KQ306_07725 [Synechococcus sp. CS-1324]|uniref:hypothetical protein n=1 Tax=Synechococcus sp. CS-1324 TaxID=2847980 RepID=UPI00223AF098|nr:hypothetical protein [Synechococcus sp. CS-1324]MCT0230738.1 hypothetical protein [Synechococcus sp. CS-1324]